MGFYKRKIFPRIMNALMNDQALLETRRKVLSAATGRTLEIGFGSGLNAPHYPPTVTELVGLDVNAGMEPLARARLGEATVPTELVYVDGTSLPFDDGSFDSVVTTWTLCSVPDVDALLAEAARVLGPEGRFHFVEHGLSTDPNIQRWQRRLSPINRLIACGCNLDRNMRAIVSKRFDFADLQEFYLPKQPRIFGYFYQGVGRPRRFVQSAVSSGVQRLPSSDRQHDLSEL